LRILGLDGLDLELAKRWGYMNLLLHRYGTLEVPISKRYGHPHSPDVWASFLTGVWHDNLRFTRPYGLHRFLDVMLWLRRKVGTSLGLGLIGEQVYSHTINQFPPLKHPLFNMKMLNVPYVNYDGLGLSIVSRFTNGKASMRDTKRALRMLLFKRFIAVDAIFEHDNVFAFIGFPDLMQHFTHNVDEVKDVYDLLDALVSDFDDLLIVADHGFNLESGMHSDVGYWSTNMDLGFTPQKITDFYPYLAEKTRHDAEPRLRRTTTR
jgi:hypothetical protein